jgi:predicted HNH restriction endonuclease
MTKDRKTISARYYKNHQKEIIIKQRALRKRQRQEIIVKLGDRCTICHIKMSGRHLVYHEIHGKYHLISNLYYTLHHLKDFVPLCSRCHVILNNFGSLTSEQRQRFMNLIKQLHKPINGNKA